MEMEKHPSAEGDYVRGPEQLLNGHCGEMALSITVSKVKDELPASKYFIMVACRWENAQNIHSEEDSSAALSSYMLAREQTSAFILFKKAYVHTVIIFIVCVQCFQRI